MFISLLIPISSSKAIPSANSALLSLNEYDQHKDTNLPVTGWSPVLNVPHPSNDAPNDAYCGTYCVPAAIAMIADYIGQTGNFILQDYIYDNGKSTQGDTIGDGIIDTRGRGMFDGSGSSSPTNITEVQAAYSWAVSSSYTEYNSGSQISPPDIRLFIDNSFPILWLDHNGWPAGMPWSAIDDIQSGVNQDLITQNQGHAKVIVGYDMNNTPANDFDDTYQILDPWPTAARTGVHDTYHSNVSDINDIFIVQTAALVEFAPNMVIIIIPVIVIAITIIIQRKRSL
jgi:hypothetical protein